MIVCNNITLCCISIKLSGWIVANLLHQQHRFSHSDSTVDRNAPSSSSSPQLLLTYLNHWVDWLQTAAPEEQTGGLRLAAALAIQQSQLLLLDNCHYDSHDTSTACENENLVRLKLRVCLIALSLLQVIITLYCHYHSLFINSLLNILY